MVRASLKWMFLIVGTTIGAGYASGREIWQFFGYESSLAIILFSIIFAVACGVIMMISYQQEATDYKSVLHKVLDGKLVRVYDFLIFTYLYSITLVMIAGSGATSQEYNLSYWWGIGFIVFILILLFTKGINLFLSFNQYIVPLLVLGLISVLLLFAVDQQVELKSPLYEQGNGLAAFPFAALNILPLIAVLAAIGEKIKSQREIWYACTGSGIVLGILTYIYNQNLIHIVDKLSAYDIPLFALLSEYSVFITVMMTLILWLSLFTTAAASMLGLVSRLQSMMRMKMWQLVILVLITILPFTAFGFTTLIRYLYPVYGILNLYILVRLLLYPMWNK